MAKTRLLMVMMAWGYFYLLAGIALFIIPEYTVILSVTRFEASLLLGVMGIAIGIGCVLAGLISGHRIEPRLIPLGAFGLTLFFFLLAIQPTRTAENSLTGSALAVLMSKESWFIFGAGISAGFYIIPLQALLQYLSPDDERGRFLGTANAVSFAFMTGSALIYKVVAPLFPDNPQQIFMVCAVLMLAGVSFFLYRLRGTGIMFGGGSIQQTEGEQA
jgi:acyl-[acyl-carrier-protein]-phospholipid O-acyltransferase/long-chain-fatty-acid--[acyl-carrier-protein] ligase